VRRSEWASFPLQTPAIDRFDELVHFYRDGTSCGKGGDGYGKEDEDVTTAAEDDDEETIAFLRKNIFAVVETIRKEYSFPPDIQEKSDGCLLPPCPSLSIEPRLFVYESSVSARRRYLTASFGWFCDKYWRETFPSCRHHYELIKEGLPCRPYLDVEFCKLSNGSISEEEEDALMNELAEELLQFISVRCRITNGQGNIKIPRDAVVDLDSSTKKKVESPHYCALARRCSVPEQFGCGRCHQRFCRTYD